MVHPLRTARVFILILDPVPDPWWMDDLRELFAGTYPQQEAAAYGISGKRFPAKYSSTFMRLRVRW